MRYLGVIYAISKVVGDHIAKTISSRLSHEGVSYSILRDEQPKEEYEANKHDLTALSGIMFKSLNNLVKKIEPSDQLVCIIAANSVHRAFPQLEKRLQASSISSQIQLLSMIEATIEACRVRKLSKPLLLASSNTIESRLYQGPLIESNISTLSLTSENQLYLDSLISQGVNSIDSREVTRLCCIVQEEAQHKSADGVLFGCAELRSNFNEKNLNMSVVDSGQSLIDQTVKIFSETNSIEDNNDLRIRL